MHGSSFSRARLSALGLRPRRGLSQSFLDDATIADEIVGLARLRPGRDEVLEVGPGLGVLTERLLRAARRVVAVELDRDLAAWLSTEFAQAALEVINADVLRVDVSKLFEKRPFVVVANLPYHITSPAIRHLLAARPEHIVVMTQREVAERIAAPAGEMSALSVIVQSQAAATLALQVSRGAFFPKPKVDSAVLVLEPRAQLAVPTEHLAEFHKLVLAGFKQPRKQLGNSLAEGLNVPKSAAIDLLHRAGLDPTVRPQDLTVDDWARLFDTR